MRVVPIRPRAAATTTDSAVEAFRDTVAQERDALTTFLNSDLSAVGAVVTMLAVADRPIVLTAVGKSGLVAAKLAATFSSLGTPAFFLNAAEAAHGDLGAVMPGSIVLLLSNSGSTAELLRIAPALVARQCRLIGILGRDDTPLAALMKHVILADIAGEADHIGLAPTASTTLQMAIGDGLAVATSRERRFAQADFLRHHPAGLLGRSMMPIRALMRTGQALPTIAPDCPVAEALPVMSAKRMGAACVVDGDGVLVGLLVDGDVRRCIEARGDLYVTVAAEVMQRQPRVTHGEMTVAEALALLRAGDRPLAVLPVVDAAGRLEGLVQALDLL